MNIIEGIKSKKADLILILLMIGTALAVSVKMLFTGFTADEEYQMVMAYRLATGDRLFTEVWDTIQTSGFLCAFLLKIFLFVTKSTTGALVFLRLCGLIIQALFALLLYDTLKRHISSKNAFLISMAFYSVFTKMIALPDFSNMQMWFLTGMVCVIWRAKEGETLKKYILIFVAAVLYCLAVLSTACVILVPLIFVFLFLIFKDSKFKSELVFWITCFGIGALYLVRVVISNGSLKNVLLNMANTVSGDNTHMTDTNIMGTSKFMTYLSDAGTLIIYLLVTAVLSYAISLVINKFKKEPNHAGLFEGVWVFMAFLVTIEKWLIEDGGYDALKLFIVVTVILGIFHGLKKTDRGDNDYTVALMGVFCGILALVNVLFISNVPLIANLGFLFSGSIWAVVIITIKWENSGQNIKAETVLIGLCVTTLFGSGYTLSSGAFGNNVFKLDGIVRNGPAKNCLMSKGAAWVYYTDYNDFANIVATDSNVLIVTDFFRNTSVTSCYMINNVNISHYSVNSTPTYSSKLLEYWEQFPDRLPDVVMVNTNAVTLREGDWIADYIEQEFDEAKSIHTENAVYYFR